MLGESLDGFGLPEFSNQLERTKKKSLLTEEFDGFGLLSEANEAAKATGLMVALPVTDDVKNQLYVDGGEPKEDMHLTLAYIGKDIPEDQAEIVKAAAKKIAESYAPLKGTVQGLGRFSASKSSDGKDVIYASYDCPVLPDLRHDLVQEIEGNGGSIKKDHGFTPHITIQYIDTELPSPIERVEPAPMVVDKIQVHYMGEVFDYPFSGKKKETE